MRVCIVQRSRGKASETFIRAHIERLPGVVGVIYHEGGEPVMENRSLLPRSWPAVLRRKLEHKVFQRDWHWDHQLAYESAFRYCAPDVVLAEYGMTGAAITPACARLGLPLVVHFHGYDAYSARVLSNCHAAYREMFAYASAIVAVSKHMARQLVSIGCPEEKVVYSPYGVDVQSLQGCRQSCETPIFISVGRFVEKKAPQLTIAAFHRVLQEVPDARLCMIGGGILYNPCRDLARGLGIDNMIKFLGEQSHQRVLEEMEKALVFVQHSITSEGGDSEGTPVSILEAGAAGLPVVATRHGGIPDVVLEGVTGHLVDEFDVQAMSKQMLRFCSEPSVAMEMGGCAARHISQFYSMHTSIKRLSCILETAMGRDRSKLA